MRFSTIIRSSAVLLIVTLGISAQDKKPCWLRDGASPAPKTAYLLCEQGGIWTTTDSGATWNSFSTGVAQRHRAFAWLDTKHGIVVGNDGTILATEDGGKTWQPRTSGVKEHLMDITFIGNSGWIAGYQGVILHSDDGGKTWTRQRSTTTLTLESLFFLDKDHGWAAGWSGTILRTSDAGATWTQIHVPSAQWTMASVYFTDANNGWICGFAGQLLRSKDGGASWTLLKSPVQSWLTSIAFDQSGRGWITYDDGLLVSEDHGETWTPVSAGGRYFLSKLLVVDQKLWAIGQATVLQSNGAKEWKPIPTLVTGSTINVPDSTSPRTQAK